MQKKGLIILSLFGILFVTGLWTGGKSFDFYIIPHIIAFTTLFWFGLPVVFVFFISQTLHFFLERLATHLFFISILPETLQIFLAWFFFSFWQKQKPTLDSFTNIKKFLFFAIALPLLGTSLLQEGIAYLFFPKIPFSFVFHHIIFDSFWFITVSFPILYFFTPFILEKKTIHWQSLIPLKNSQKWFSRHWVFLLFCFWVLINHLFHPFDKYWFFYGFTILFAALSLSFGQLLALHLWIAFCVFLLPTISSIPSIFQFLQNKNQIFHYFIILLSFFFSGILIAASKRENEENMQKLNAVFHNTFQLTGLLDKEGKIIFVNQAALDFVGTKKELVEGKYFWETPWWYNEKEIEKLKTAIALALNKENVRITVSHPNHLNEIHTIDFSLKPILDSFGNVKYLLAEGRDIEDLLFLQEKSQEYETNYERLFTQMLSGFSLHEVITDNNGKPIDYRFLDINPAFERLTGLKREAIIGKTVLEVLPKTEPYWIERFGNVALTGKPELFENYSVEMGKYYEVIAYSPKKNQFAVIFNDITERKLLEKNLKESEERYRFTLENLPVGVGIFDKNTQKTLYLNRYFKELFGYEEQDIPYLEDWFQKAYPDKTYREKIIQKWKENKESLISNKTIDTIQTKEGLIRNVELSLQTFENLIIVLFNERSESYLIEKNMQELQRRYFEIIENIPLIALMLDKEGKILYCNSYMLSLSGYQKQEIVGKDYFAIFTPHLVQLKGKYKELIENKTTKPYYENTILLKNKEERLISWKQTFLKNIEGEIIGTAYIGEDITEKRKIEEHLKELKEKAEKANQVKTLFLANMSHEIRTPMNGIIGMTEILLLTNPTEEQKKYLNYIKNSADDLLRIINDILDLSKIEFGKMDLEIKNFDLENLIIKAIDPFSIDAFKKNVNLAYFIEPEVPLYLRSDEGKIYQILSNLISNAVKFTEKGDIYIYVKNIENKENTVTLQIGVKDTGIGIPKNKLEEIFQPFTQGDSSYSKKYQGTGLGLSLSQKLAELLDSKIEVKSEENKGSDFYFILELEKGDSPINTPYISLMGKKALVIEDNTLNQQIVQKYLETAGITSVVLENGIDITEKIDFQSFDFILLDMVLPSLDGIDVFKKIREKDKKIPILIFASMDIRDRLKELEPYHLQGYVLKPIKKNELLLKIQEILSKTGAEEKSVSLSSPQSKKILLVEDNELNRLSIQILLEQKGYSVLIAKNGEEAIEQTIKNNPSLIFMDIQMPVLNGIDATKRIRERGINTPIVALTAYAMKGDREKFLEAGMNDYLAKPVLAKDLLQTVEKYLSKID